MLLIQGRLDPTKVPNLSDRDLILLITVSDVIGLLPGEINILHAERRHRIVEESRMTDEGAPPREDD